MTKQAVSSSLVVTASKQLQEEIEAELKEPEKEVVAIATLIERAKKPKTTEKK